MDTAKSSITVLQNAKELIGLQSIEIAVLVIRSHLSFFDATVMDAKRKGERLALGAIMLDTALRNVKKPTGKDTRIFAD